MHSCITSLAALLFFNQPVASYQHLTVLEFLNEKNLKPGDALIFKLANQNEQGIHVEFEGSEVPLFKYRDHMRGIIPLSPKMRSGGHSLAIQREGQEKIFKEFHLEERRAKIILLPVPQNLFQTPRELVRNLAKQQAVIAETIKDTNPNPLFSKPFGLPLSDNRRVSSLYGEIRKTGNESIRHVGVDFAEIGGTLVYAINDGRIARTYTDPIYGKTVIVDHGAGISSLYMHLNEIKIREGVFAPQGKVLGTVGTSGYSSARHLHLSLKIRGQSVDPLQFVKTWR